MQILVVVANVQARILKTEVEKGFALTAIVRKIVGPERSGKTTSRCGGRCSICFRVGSSSLILPSSKGKQVEIPVP